VRRTRGGEFPSDKVWLHEAGVIHVERRVFTVLIDEEEAKTVLSTYFQGEPQEERVTSQSAEEQPHSENMKGPETDAKESRREKKKREKREEYKDWYDSAREIKGEGRWTRKRDIAGQVVKRGKGKTADSVRRRLNEYYPGWAD
jgi:hypothetical protein